MSDSPTAREPIVRGAREHADRVAVVLGDEERTHAEADRLGNRLALGHPAVREVAVVGTPDPRWKKPRRILFRDRRPAEDRRRQGQPQTVARGAPPEG